jgi:hypothetical protein
MRVSQWWALHTAQILADYAGLLTWWKETHNATTCPVIAFGGSYGGTLTTYFRRAYPGAVCFASPRFQRDGCILWVALESAHLTFVLGLCLGV